jgi:hypothetical protein
VLKELKCAAAPECFLFCEFSSFYGTNFCQRPLTHLRTLPPFLARVFLPASCTPSTMSHAHRRDILPSIVRRLDRG